MMGLASGTNAGAFGEVASLNTCHCLMFNSTNKTNVWTLYSSFNTSLQFYIVKPNLTDTTIMTSVTNGTIQPNSYYTINVMVVSSSLINQSGYLSAYVGSNNNNAGGASVRLGANKLIKIKGTGAQISTNNQTTLQSGGTNQSVVNSTTTILQSAQITQNKNSSAQSAGGGAVALSVSVILPYLIAAIVLLLVIVCALLYKVTRKSSSVNNFRKRKSVRRKRS